MGKSKVQNNKKSGFSWKKSIKTKLISSMLLVAAVPLIVSVAISYYTSTNQAIVDAIDSLEWQAWYVQGKIYSVIQANESSITAFAESPTTIAFMKGEEVDMGKLKAQMQSIDEYLGDGNVLVLTNDKGQMLLRDDDGDLVDISSREFWQGAMQGKFTVSNVIVSASTGKRSISMAAPVIDPETNKIIGTVHRNYDLNDFHEILASECDEGFVIDRNGDMMAHSQYEIGPDDEVANFSASPYMNTNEIEGSYKSTAVGYPTYLAYARDDQGLCGFTVCVAKRESLIVSAARKSASIVIAIGIMLLIIAAVISVMLAQSFANPIAAVDDSLSILADGRFKQINGFSNREDEIGKIVKSTNTVIERLSGIVGSIKASAGVVGDSSEKLSEMANQIASTTDGVANAVQEIASGAAQQAEEIQQAAESVGRITDAVTGVQNSTENMEVLAGKMKEASQTSSRSLLNLQTSSSDMTEKIEEIARTISATKDAVTSINESVEGISGIASQTNLLSLNASIEAARAGEAGKGFAVVAEEIRKLADDSDSMAQDIRTQMDILLKQSEAAVAAANLVKQGNLDQQEAIGGTLDSVNGMLEDIDGTVDGVKEIAGGADTCVTSNDIVSDAMSSLSAISEENAASSETTGASVQELSATVSTLAASAEDLKDIAIKLNEEISFFKDDLS
ncbi:methyl-accepting chemotaxis protein [Pseudobutyrivibrio sp. ACV-2]|uniref:methyl-accepting chemotaxis protein n=1 Tax=Pseudobutyrivibrio sp. ACV-2 TaxID=1520801 RepID=UPI00089BC40B|nr:methyl-accepting chemotaxis protein [Pseudobutyrivibrio sp. ACV-2]SEA92882.1 methyl-accepting chemotaxis protein [Pseudobutyrivibrio sp. ACV-2]